MQNHLRRGPLIALCLWITAPVFAVRPDAEVPEMTARRVPDVWDVPAYNTAHETNHEHEVLDAMLDGITSSIYKKYATPEILQEYPFLRNRAWEGNSHVGNRPEQAHSYYDLVRSLRPSKMCEIGMNGGHSAALFLAAADRQATLHMFDRQEFKYSSFATSLISDMYPRKFHLIQGDSHVEVPKFSSSHGRICDFFSIDGDHSYEGCRQDILNAINASKAQATIILDDMRPDLDTRKAFDNVVAAGLLTDPVCTPIVRMKIPYKDRFDYDGPFRDGQNSWCRAKVP